jgi:Kdo2-lipid IVA lauroyltransferase/acyltransferase
MKKLKKWFVYVFFKIFFLMIKSVPLTWCSWAGKHLGYFAYRVLKLRRRLTVENIRQARERGFLSAEIKDDQLAGQVWRTLGMVGSESLYYYTRPPEQFKDSVRWVGEENLRQVLEKKKGVILVMAHIGNWELLGISMSSAGYSLTPIVKTQSNLLLDKIIQEQRQAVGMKTIPQSGFLRPILEALKRNEIIPFLIDQSAGSIGVQVDFFGRRAPIPRGAAEFALKTETPVIFAYLVRESLDQHLLVISEELKLQRTGNYQQDLVANTAMFIQLVQETVQKYPSQWLWMHKLWPTEIKC